MLLFLLFWILLILYAIGLFAPLGPRFIRGHDLVLVILLVILGYWAKGNPFSR